MEQHPLGIFREDPTIASHPSLEGSSYDSLLYYLSTSDHIPEAHIIIKFDSEFAQVVLLIFGKQLPLDGYVRIQNQRQYDNLMSLVNSGCIAITGWYEGTKLIS